MAVEDEREIADLKARLAALEQQQTSAPGPAQKPEVNPYSHLSSYRAPGQGTAKKPKLPAWVLIGGAIVALVIIAGLVGQHGGTPSGGGEPATTSAAAAAAAADKASDAASAAMVGAVTSETKWTYSDEGDALHDAKTHFACTTSTNVAVLSQPYSPVTAQLCVRRKPGGKLDAYVKLDGDGQILCGIEECSTPIRFDTGQITHFPSVGAADGSSNIIFINRASSFVAALKHSSKAAIELQFYQNGNQDLEFATAGLRW
jgi:hypothetical protein